MAVVVMEATGSSPFAPAIEINNSQAANQGELSAKRANLGGQLGGLKWSPAGLTT
jgi:hypothetical protein